MLDAVPEPLVRKGDEPSPASIICAAQVHCSFQRVLNPCFVGPLVQFNHPTEHTGETLVHREILLQNYQRPRSSGSWGPEEIGLLHITLYFLVGTEQIPIPDYHINYPIGEACQILSMAKGVW